MINASKLGRKDSSPIPAPKSTALFKGSHLSPACPFDKSSMKIRLSMEHWWKQELRLSSISRFSTYFAANALRLRLMIFGEIIMVGFEDHTKHANTPWTKFRVLFYDQVVDTYTKFCTSKQLVCIVTTALQSSWYI